MSLENARSRVMRERWSKRGIICPCCDQLAKVRPRNVYLTLAKILLQMSYYDDQHPREWISMPAFLSDCAARRLVPKSAPRGGDYAKLKHWDLIEAQVGQREDGSSRVGQWRITEFGAAFCRGETVIPKFAYVYGSSREDERVLGYSDGENVTFADCFEEGFVYSNIL